MKNIRCSIRTILSIIIGFMGTLGLVLSLVSGVVHRNLAFDNQRNSLIELIRLKTNDLLSELESKSRDLGLALQSEPAFRAAFGGRDKAPLVELLDNQFHQYFVTAGVIKLEKLMAFDNAYNLIAESSEKSSSLTPEQFVCPQLIAQAKYRTGPERMKILSDLCLVDGRPFYAVMVPIGGLRPKGSLVVVTDPSHSLIPIESALGMSLRISTTSGHILYQSNSWPSVDAMHNIFEAKYILKTPSNDPALSISIVHDHKPLNEELRKARILVMLVAGMATLLAVVVAVWILRNTSLRPLSALTRQLRLLRNNRMLLGEQVPIGGTTEIRELARDFNEMTSELHNLYAALEHMAFTDPLTKLPNRNHFHDRLRESAQAYQHTKRPFALLLMDLDRFKGVNDTLGHHIGDRLLQEVGERLKTALRGSDMVARLDEQTISQFEIARLGGDEFAAILTDIRTTESAAIVARKLLSTMEQPFVLEIHKFIIGISIGIAIYPDHGEDEHTLMRRADVAMYHAKKTKRGFAFYEKAQDDFSLRHLTLERDLLNAINNNELILHYQPKVNLNTGAVCGTEALVRWQHPEQGLILPDDFIPLAEQSGLIQQLSGWILNKALEHCAAWQNDGLPIGVSINLSAINLHDRHIANTIAEALQRWSVAPESLVLELTESAVMSDPGHALEILNQLDAMGVGLSVDDFGTGYSSLAYVKKLPVDEIKIDKSFVKEMGPNNSDEAIVRSVIVLAHHMGLTVVAEGVEDQQPWKRLKELSCDMVQGNFIAKPMPIDEYRRWLKTAN